MENGLDFKPMERPVLQIEVDTESPPFTGQRCDVILDASPISSSRYSSCGESEFDRYCSANSVMGAPSVCSSSVGGFQDCLESDFGSVKSFGGGESDGGFEGFGLGGGGRFDWDHDKNKSGEEGKEEGDDRLSIGVEASDVFEGVACLDDAVEVSSFEGVSPGGGVDERVSELSDVVGAWQEGVEGAFDSKKVNGDSNLRGDVHCNGSQCRRERDQFIASGSDGFLLRTMQEIDETGNDRRRGEDDGASSGYEHSDGDDSMFNYDSDDENRHAGYHIGNKTNRAGMEGESGNSMLMNTSVAFGSKDWEDFEHEIEEIAPAFQMFVEFQESLGQQSVAEINSRNIGSSSSVGFKPFDDKQQGSNSIDVPMVDGKIQAADKYSESMTCSATLANPLKSKEPIGKEWSNISVVSKEVHGDDETEEYLQGCGVYDIFVKQDILSHPAVTAMSSVTMDRIPGEECSSPSACNNVGDSHDPFVTSEAFEGFPTEDTSQNKRVEFSREKESKSVASVCEVNDRSISNVSNPTEDREKGKSCDVNQFYDEVVNEMEEILFDSSEALVDLSSHSNAAPYSPLPSLSRDGGPTASTSGLHDGYTQPLKINGIEVVGAKQKKGDISLSERLVGVKEHTVYVIRVWAGNDQWDIERRYRDFYTLYRELKSSFAQQGLVLPPPWSSVEQESRKIFGNVSPDVIAQRSVLIQECLRSILQHKLSSGVPSSLIWFLSPTKDLPDSPNALMGWSMVAVDARNLSSLGKTIPLIVELRPYKPTKQMLEIQHHICAGCHRNFYDGTSRMQEFVQTFGWGKPRLCEYTGQLFCSSCHINDMAVLPARVLHHWDFNEYPISQLAKSYLDSILDQPMLCVSAVNPFLFSKVPALLHVVGIRKKIGAMLPYVHCPFRSTICRGLRSRRYLLESNDFFALRDLIDLSKGAFAALPVILETVLKKIEEHITEQCLVCCDVGIPCGARQACNDPSSLIFPFQEEEAVQRCEACKSVFHKHCYERLLACPCGAHLMDDNTNKSITKLSPRTHNGADGTLPLLRKKSDFMTSEGLLSRLFSAGRQSKRHVDSDNVILMGSLPNTSI